MKYENKPEENMELCSDIDHVVKNLEPVEIPADNVKGNEIWLQFND